MQEGSLGPADIATLYDCLRGALSPDPNLQKGAEETLKALGDRQGFCSCLAVRSLHLCIQHFSIGFLKGSSKRRWRSTGDPRNQECGPQRALAGCHPLQEQHCTAVAAARWPRVQWCSACYQILLTPLLLYR